MTSNGHASGIQITDASRGSCPDASSTPLSVPGGIWTSTHTGPYKMYPACPFLRPWESCMDDPCRRERWSRRRFVSDGSTQIKEFNAADIHRLLENRLLLFAGDSIQVQHFTSFACMLHAEGRFPVNKSTLKWRSPETLRKRCFGMSKCHYEHGCIFFNSGLRVCVCAIVALERRLFSQCKLKYRPRAEDIVYYGSIGIHYTGEMGTRVETNNASTIKQLAILETTLVLDTFMRSYHKVGSTAPRLLWREVTAQHFANRGGHYKQANPKDDYNRKSVVKLPCSSNHSINEMRESQLWNKYTNPIVHAADVTILRIWFMTALAWDAHVEYGDCTHWCLPGMPDNWAHLLAQALGSFNSSWAHSNVPKARHLRNQGQMNSERRGWAAAELQNENPCTYANQTCVQEFHDPPSWLPGVPIRLMLAVNAGINNRLDLKVLLQCLCMLRLLHAESFIHVLAHGNAHQYASELRTIPLQHTRTSVRSCGSLLWRFRSLALTAQYAARHNATHFAFLQHSMVLLKPFPMSDLKCPFVAFEAHVALSSVPSHGFLCNKRSLTFLVESEFFSKCVSNEEQDHATSVSLALVAERYLNSPLLHCSLDGCASKGSAKDTALCFSKTFLGQRRNIDLSSSPPVAGHTCGLNLTTETPFSRFVAPPYTIAQPIFAGVASNGTTLFGSSAFEYLSTVPPEFSRVLIYVHSFTITPFEQIHVEMIKTHCVRRLPLVAKASILLASNNRNIPTAHLVRRLRGYLQPFRWVFHSPTNPGCPHEQKPGYLCGEMATLAESSQVWSHFRWIFYSNPDVVVTPEFFVKMSARLEKDTSQIGADVSLYADQFPNRWRRPPIIRYAMEYFVFRAAHFLNKRNSHFHNDTGMSVFDTAAQTCLESQKGIFPESLMSMMVSKFQLNVKSLNAVNYIRYTQREVNALLRDRVRAQLAPPTWNVQMTKTALVPGAVWHNEDLALANSYLRNQSRCNNSTG